MTTRPRPNRLGPRLTTEADLLAVLERARTVGFLGPGPLRVHVDHARDFVRLVAEHARGLDLGSGGGLPALPMLVDDPTLEITMLDASQKRCSFLVWAASELGVADRADVVNGRAEESAHDPSLREQFDAVVARGFGPPAVTVECGAAFLRVGGRLIISEPPERRRWRPEGLAAVGLELVGHDGGVVSFVKTVPSDSTSPRSSKRMLRAPHPVVA